MMSGSDATAPPYDGHEGPGNMPIVAVVESPPPGSSIHIWNNHKEEVKSVLSSGRLVAILGGVSNFPKYSWDEESLVSITRRQGTGAMIQWHCKYFFNKVVFSNR